MTTEDKRLDRTVTEVIGNTATYTESEIKHEDAELDDHDHALIMETLDRDIILPLRRDLFTRQAISLTGERKCCIVGVQVLVRDYIHVISWLRSSDIQKYRAMDLALLYEIGDTVRRELGMDKQIMAHVYTSSLHETA